MGFYWEGGDLQNWIGTRAENPVYSNLRDILQPMKQYIVVLQPLGALTNQGLPLHRILQQPGDHGMEQGVWKGVCARSGGTALPTNHLQQQVQC